jgi:Tfp pilus assembly protein PilF
MKSSKPSVAHANTDWISLTTCAAAIVLAFLIDLVYLPAVHVPLIYDDLGSIVNNESIESVWPLIAAPPKQGPLNPPANLPTSGRPLVNLSFALNRHFGGLNPTGYHIVNITIHFFSSMLVWAITRRTLRLPFFGREFESSADWIALAVATIWAIHPLQTEAVIYATQRTELMMALFYLATLYFSLRYWQADPLRTVVAVPDTIATPKHPASQSPTTADGQSHNLWLILAVLTCLCGMASKEVMASAPLIVLLFERTLVTRSFLKALRNSWPLYCGLAATWILLIATHVPSPHSDSAGFSAGVPAYVWWFTQAYVMWLYLKLAAWPWPLLIHYQPPYLTTFAHAWIYVIPLLILGITTLAMLLRNAPVGLLGTWFFAILAPTSVVPIITEIAAERRMYLALLPLVAMVVIGGYGWLARKSLPTPAAPNALRHNTSPLLVLGGITIALSLLFCIACAIRLTAYNSEMTLWLDVLKHNPDDPLAHLNKATHLERNGNIDAAIKEYREAIRLDPAYTHAHYNLGILLNQRGESDEAAKHFAEAARCVPKNAVMRNNIGVALYSSGQNDQAIDAFQKAIELDPAYSVSYRNLGTALQKAGRFQEAATALEKFQKLNPNAIEVYNRLANIYLRLNQRAKAIVILQQGLERARTAGNQELAKEFADKLRTNQ